MGSVVDANGVRAIEGRKTSVTREELDSRRNAVLAAMAEQAIDAAVFTAPHNILYLSGVELGGFHSSRPALVLSADGTSRLLIREVDKNWYGVWSTQTWATEWVPYSDDIEPAQALADVVRSIRPRGTTRLGMELGRPSIAYETVLRVGDTNQAKYLVDVARIVESLRVIKSPAELAHMRSAALISKAGQEAATQVVRDGGTDAEATIAGQIAMDRLGSEFYCTAPDVSSGSQSATGHTHSFGRKVRDGETLRIYMGASVNRYQSPLSRTYVKGTTDRRTTAMIDSIVSATEAALASLRPGMTSHEADGVARQVVAEAGFAEFYINRLAYGIGIGFPPIGWEADIIQLRPHDDRVLMPGMTFHLVPGLHAPGVGQITRSMSVVITDTGCEPLIDYPLNHDPL